MSDYKERNIQNTMKKCNHFKDMFTNDSCKKDMIYSEFQSHGLGGLPCFKGVDATVKCSVSEFPTREEAEEQQRELENWTADFNKALEDNNCPHCGVKKITKRQVGQCVYGSCGCRLYQGRLLQND